MTFASLITILTMAIQAQAVQHKPHDLGLNDSEKVHVMTAGLATAAIPGGLGVGHYLYDRPDIGRKYLITQSVLGLTSLGLALSCPEKKSKVLINPDCKGHTETALNISFGAFLTIWIWQIFDVIANGKSYINEKPMSFQMHINENQNLILGLNFNF